MKGGLLLLTAAALCFSGCASYTIKPIVAEDPSKWGGEKAEEGYVFYQPELYFLVTPAGGVKATPADDKEKKDPKADDKAAGLTVTPIYLPNPAKPYRVTTFNFLAKSDFAFNFKDGWQLTSISDKADNTTVANTLAGELKTILAAGGIGFMAMEKTQAESFLLHPQYTGGIITGFDVIALPKPSQKREK